MNKLKKGLSILLVAFICGLATIVHAEEVDSYFVWEIKNFETYQANDLLLEAASTGLTNDGSKDIISIRDTIYRAIIDGRYLEAAFICEKMEAYQKIRFGEDYLDESLTELTAKLYLMAEELDKAEQKINLLSDNAKDDFTKLRALNLKSDLFNRRGDYQGALNITETATKLLRNNTNENLSLINQARAAKAYYGLNETQKSLEIAEKILPLMQKAFGNAGIETLALMSTLVEDYIQTRRYEDCKKILDNKIQTINMSNHTILANAETYLQFIELYFETNDIQNAEKFLHRTLNLSLSVKQDGNHYHSSLNFYKALNEIATKHLDDNHPIVLRSALGLAGTYNSVGDIQQSITICNENLLKFKKVFGENDYQTLELMKILCNDFILLGKYSDAEQVAKEIQMICEENAKVEKPVNQRYFGEYDIRAVESSIILADIYYRTCQYNVADELIAEIEINNQDFIKYYPEYQCDLLLTKCFGNRKVGLYSENKDFLNKALELEKYLDITRKKDVLLESLKNVSDIDRMLGTSNETIIILLNTDIVKLSEYHPKVLEIMNILAEYYIAQGKLGNAETLTQKIFELSREHFGENNFYEWLSLSTLSKIRRAEEDFANALVIDKQALQVIEQTCGKNSLERLTTLDAIADDYTGVDNFVEAIKIREQILSEYEEILEEDDPNILQTMTKLTENYITAKKYDEAEELCDEVFANQKSPMYVDNHISFDDNIMNLFRVKATLQKAFGDNTGAATNYEQLVQAYEIKRNTTENKLITTDENKSRWFAKITPVYKQAADVAQGVGNTNFAFYCMEFCKGRNLIDRYDDILVSKSWLLGPYERDELATYQKSLNDCLKAYESAIKKNNDV